MTMTLSWFPLVLVYIVTNTISKIIQKQAVKDDAVDPTAFSACFLFTVGIMTLPFLFVEKIVLTWDLKVWLAVLLSSIFYTACMALFYHAMKQIEVSQVEAVATTRSIWVMVIGVVFFHETLGFSKFVGVMLIFLGLAATYWDQGKFTNFARPHFYTLGYALMISSAYALDKYALNYFSVCLYQVIIYIFPSLITAIFMPGTLGKMKAFLKPQKTTYFILLCCFFQMISTLALYRAYQVGGELSVVGPLSQITTVLTIMTGILLLKERWNLKNKIAGVILAFLGVLFIKVIRF